ncbi:MAG: hypothetical protein WCZ47_03910 [Bacilli bacterium]|jgi:hypothetical protein|nr:hypothetical protein [Bacilli bacterium]NLN80447.1 hypothetical protein [Erysipelotrichia bacterium]
MAKTKKDAPVLTPSEIIKDLKQKHFSRLKRLASSDEEYHELLNIFAASKNTYGGVSRREVKTYAPDFILEIERALPSLEAIVNDPHRFIKETAEVVGVEKAKKITQRSIEHMSQNTQNIRSVGSDGTIEPKRVLNMFMDDELKIYENRFIMTLVRRLQAFIELRYKYISEHSDTRHSDIVKLTSEMKIDEVSYEFETKMRIVVPSDDDGKRHANADLLDRLLHIRKRITYLTTSRFMLEMRKVAPVSDPVQQTNIMRLNYEYQAAYRLWLFITRYDVLGIEYRFSQNDIEFKEDYLDDLHLLMLSSYLTLRSDHTMPSDKKKQYFYKPRFKKVRLDVDLTDDKIIGKSVTFGVDVKKETLAQIEAKIKRAEAAEKRRQLRLEERAKERQLALEKREEAKKLAALKALEKKEKERQRKLLLAKRKQDAILAKKEKERLEKLRLEEEALLAKAREQVINVAKMRRKEDE